MDTPRYKFSYSKTKNFRQPNHIEQTNVIVLSDDCVFLSNKLQEKCLIYAPHSKETGNPNQFPAQQRKTGCTRG